MSDLKALLARPINGNPADFAWNWFGFLVFGLAAWTNSHNVAGLVAQAWNGTGPEDVVIALIAAFSSLSFSCLIAVLFLIRRQPLCKTDGVVPRIITIWGAFLFPTCLSMLDATTTGALRLIGTNLSLIGLVLAVLSLARLGRSFSIMPEARRLVTSGPYALVRHPLYAAELFAAFGVLLQKLSVVSVTVYVVHVAIMIQRMTYEEAVLTKQFPDYQTYRCRVARLIPFVY